MKLNEVTSGELAKLRDSYRAEVRRETQASHDVRRMWQIVIAVLDAELARRFNGGARDVLDATKMTLPGDEPLA